MRPNPLALGLHLLLQVLSLSDALPINSPMLQVYDYIIVGGGASGLTVANRLSENSTINVLVLEAGPADNYEDDILIPAKVGLDIISQYNWNLTSVPQVYLDGKVRSIPQGRGLGGGTLINALLWNRGGQGDYDDWAALGNPGWNWQCMLPYFMKSETFTNDVSEEDADQFSIYPNLTVHGTSGPVNVTYSKYFYNSSQLFFDGLKTLGVPIADDPNEGLVAGGSFLPMDIDPNNMTRSSARYSYYEPYSSRPNFNVQVGQQVTRLLFDNSICGNGKRKLRVIGVEYAQNSTAPRYQVYASREVVMAAGSLHTPKILELSGIGQTSVLSNFGIQTVLELPGVGNNLQDHYLTGLNWPYQNQTYVTPNSLLTNATFAEWAADQYYGSRTGPWTAGPPNGVAFPSLPNIAPNQSQQIIAAAATQTYGQHLPSGLDNTVLAGYKAMHKLMVKALANPNRAAYELLNANTGYFTQSIMRPFSRGTTHISSSDPFASPAIDPRYGSNPIDLQVLLATYKFQFRLLATPSMQLLQPQWWIPWPQVSDNEIMDLMKLLIQTEYHVSGSCAMLPLRLGGVVDSNVLVYGTRNLRIVDASLQPMTPAAHLQAVVYGVAEKCADIIKAAPAYTRNPTIQLPPTITMTCASPTNQLNATMISGTMPSSLATATTLVNSPPSSMAMSNNTLTTTSITTNIATTMMTMTLPTPTISIMTTSSTPITRNALSSLGWPISLPVITSPAIASTSSSGDNGVYYTTIAITQNTTVALLTNTNTAIGNLGIMLTKVYTTTSIVTSTTTFFHSMPTSTTTYQIDTSCNTCSPTFTPPPSSLGLLPAITITPELMPTMGFPLPPPLYTESRTVMTQWTSWSTTV